MNSYRGGACEQLVRHRFQEQFRTAPALVVRAPGRVNLIGEHTDYNDGFVLPLAINRAVWIALRPRTDRHVLVHSLDFDGSTAFTLDELTRGAGGWPEYVKGVAWVLQQAGHGLRGWEGVIAGDVPVGAGLSSSAALELAVARAFAAVSELPWDAARMARLGQRAENEWVGVRCGIMDQMISAAGRAGHALLIDCRSLDIEAVPFPPGTTVVVLDTATRRGLVDSAYNERRGQCEAAARAFGVSALRDLSVPRFQAECGQLDEVTRPRARHVVTENERTLQAAEAMRRGDAAALGQLMNASHESLRDDFAVSSRELDIMVDCGRAHPACLGIRMTGAGFGGCAVALIHTEQAESFTRSTAASYESATGIKPVLYVCTATEGAEVVL
ncbi:MAG TPA: galactokinase [Gemmataceae bacterium]|nr:galactokinase [Gemmataceae bacterium]